MPNLLPKPVPISDPTGSLGYLAIDLETTDFPGSPRAELFSVSWLVVEEGVATQGECLGVEGTRDPTGFLPRPAQTVRPETLRRRLPELLRGRTLVTYGARLDAPLLQKYLADTGVIARLNIECVHEQAKTRLPEAPTFAPRQLAKHLGITADDVPPLLRDAMITARVYEHLCALAPIADGL